MPHRREMAARMGADCVPDAAGDVVAEIRRVDRRTQPAWTSVLEMERRLGQYISAFDNIAMERPTALHQRSTAGCTELASTLSCGWTRTQSDQDDPRQFATRFIVSPGKLTRYYIHTPANED